jgi:copper chaperone CopZ
MPKFFIKQPRLHAKAAMKIRLILSLVLVSLTTAIQAADNPASTTANATNRFRITGMSCDGCARGLTAELRLASGVFAADVSFTNKLAVVAYDSNQISVEGLKKVITEAGYEAKLAKSGKSKSR